MKGATIRAALEALGALASNSRRRVSNDNPFSEALYRASSTGPRARAGTL